MSVRTGQLFREIPPGGVWALIDEVDGNDAVSERQRGLEGVGEAGQNVIGGYQPVDDDRDVVLDLFLERRRLIQLDLLAVDDGARVAARRKLFEEVDELALLLRHHRTDDLVAGAGFERHELVGDLLHRLAGYLFTTFRAVRNADSRPEQSHVVVDFGNRADGRPWVAVGRLLVDRNGGAQTLDEIDIGTVDLPQELPCISRQGLDVASLAFGENRVKCQGGLARPGKPGEHDK